MNILVNELISTFDSSRGYVFKQSWLMIYSLHLMQLGFFRWIECSSLKCCKSNFNYSRQKNNSNGFRSIAASIEINHCDLKCYPYTKYIQNYEGFCNLFRTNPSLRCKNNETTYFMENASISYLLQPFCLESFVNGQLNFLIQFRAKWYPANNADVI